MSTIAHNLQMLQNSLDDICLNNGRNPDSVTIIGASKTKNAVSVREAWKAGLRDFGENYVQEAQLKRRELKELTETYWHFIGSIQRRKARTIAQEFDWVHSVDREDVADALSKGRSGIETNLNVCIQVNLDSETSKSGVEPENTAVLARAVSKMPRITLRGLMAIPAPRKEESAQCAAFRVLRELKETIEREEGIPMDTLSMGMSADFPQAIAEGATIVRIGTAIFGERQKVAS